MKNLGSNFIAGILLGLGVIVTINFCRMVFDMGYIDGRYSAAASWAKQEGNVIKFPVKPESKDVADNDKTAP